MGNLNKILPRDGDIMGEEEFWDKFGGVIQAAYREDDPPQDFLHTTYRGESLLHISEVHIHEAYSYIRLVGS